MISLCLIMLLIRQAISQNCDFLYPPVLFKSTLRATPAVGKNCSV